MLEAIQELPQDLQSSIGYSFTADNRMIVTVAGEPLGGGDDDHSESSVSKVEIAYWPSMREKGWPPEDDEFYGPGGIREEVADGPVISIAGDAEGTSQGFYGGRASVASFMGNVQLALLEEMYSGGGMSLICKDEKGRFIREDGSRILDWQ